MGVILFLVFVAVVDCLDERQIQVAELPVSKFVPPNCNYTVRIGDREGKLVVGSVTVGDPLYHRWSCASTGNLYCIMVHSCTLGHNESKARGKRVEIIDEFGCSVYPELVPNMNYIGDTEAGFKASAFLIDIDQVLISWFHFHRQYT
ncbi:hypothetical protein FO519_004262 [Halicephalobus sp. NKZ332]|nr:hypothetical protein FO519_004262 [Halicephalobus sp. NKZ332]